MCLTHACVLLPWTTTTTTTTDLATRKIFWPFCLRQQFISIVWKSTRLSPCCKWSKRWIWEGLGTMLHAIPSCKPATHSFSSLIPTQLSVTYYHTTSSRKPKKEATQSTLWLLSPRKSCIPTWCTRVSQQLQLTKSYKSSCKSALFMASHLPYCTKQKYYRQKGVLQTVSRQREVLAVFRK